MLCRYLLVHSGPGLPLNKDVCREKRPWNLRPSVHLLLPFGGKEATWMKNLHHPITLVIFTHHQYLFWGGCFCSGKTTHTHMRSQHRSLTSWPLKPNVCWPWLQIHCKNSTTGGFFLLLAKAWVIWSAQVYSSLIKASVSFFSSFYISEKWIAHF